MSERMDLRRLDWGHQRSLFQPRQPAFWAYCGLVIATLFLVLAEQRVLLRISGQGWLLAWVLVLVYAAPVILLVLVLDLFEKEPWSLVAGAFVWGAVVATSLAGPANQGWALVVERLGGPEFAAQWTAALTAPLVEETLKVLGVVMIYLIARGEIDDLMDGFVYGAVCGLGFAVVEDVFYFMAVFGGSPSDVLEGFVVRVLASGLYGHVLYTGVAGMGFAYFVTRKGERPAGFRAAVAVGAFACAVAAHFLWNSPLLDFFPAQPWTGGEWLLVFAAGGVKGLPFLAFVVAMVWLAHRRERRWLDTALGTEVGGESMSRDDYETLRHPLARRRARREMRARAGPGAARLLKRLQQEQLNLAMVITRRQNLDGSRVQEQRRICRALRDALSAIPGAASATSSEFPSGPARE